MSTADDPNDVPFDALFDDPCTMCLARGDMVRATHLWPRTLMPLCAGHYHLGRRLNVSTAYECRHGLIDCIQCGRHDAPHAGRDAPP